MYSFVTKNMTEILYKADQWKHWSALLGIKNLKEGDRFKNPLRNDNKPGCWLSPSIYDSNIIVLNDFGGDREYHGLNLIVFWSKLKNKSIQEVCTKIFNLLPTEKKNSKVATEVYNNVNIQIKLQYKARKWYLQDQKYWNQYGISLRDLHEDKVFPVLIFNLYNDVYKKTIKPRTLCYALTINNRVKLYQPYAKEAYKWKSFLHKEDFWLKERVNSNTLIITKSYKDLRTVWNHSDDISVAATQSESIIQFPKKLESLVDSYENVILLYDNDSQGVKSSSRIKQFYPKIEVKFVDNFKDISDFRKNNNELKTKEIMKNIRGDV